MFILGHIGPTAVAAHAADRKIDLRWAATLALAPDLIDKPVAFLLPALVNENTRGFAHSAIGVLFVLAFLLALRRRVKTPLSLWACYAGHLLLDRMWLNNNPAVFFWPLLGPFPEAVHGYRNSLLVKWNIYGEIVGLLLLIGLFRRLRLHEPGKLRAFLKTGAV